VTITVGPAVGVMASQRSEDVEQYDNSVASSGQLSVDSALVRNEIDNDTESSSSESSVEIIEPITAIQVNNSSNPFIGLLEQDYMTVASSSDYVAAVGGMQDGGLLNNIDASDTITLKSNSSCTCLAAESTAPVASFQDSVSHAEHGLSDNSALSGDDIAFNYMRLRDTNSPLSAVRDSGPSSLCSASPFESPTHAAASYSRYDETAHDDDIAVGCRPDSLYLSRSAIQRREKQWLAKKGSYSSLSECDSSHSGSMDALIEAATSTPLHAQGTVAIDGDMITFVADGINELIKRSRNGNAAFIWNIQKISAVYYVLNVISIKLLGVNNIF